MGKKLIFSIFILAFSNLSFAQNLNFLKQIESNIQNIKSLKCNFTQEKHLSIFKKVLISKGKFYFQKPDYLRWEYTEPVKMGFCFLKNTGKSWNDVDKKIKKFNISENRQMALIKQQIIVWTTFNLKWISSQFSFKILSKNPLKLQLTPKQKNIPLKYLKLQFNKDQQTLHSLELYEKDLDFTRLIFYNHQINLKESIPFCP
ncbi:Outer membrane lipoprotein-sorting protein [Desulfonauticus submarinus]|uniref:Outer membrane lipoprotein-sorting protein n=1 Tax=Desulfonauticus submarinus TaxID=206665 RepID=A0A1H0FST2_9BACT|nr:outer membrane lipoprotein carrier protein LolA [Desulfonauticus submarinus]SDN97695.1 Outer membrane lipoprotein-sorting protein [Desulfonauticus submarinus]